MEILGIVEFTPTLYCAQDALGQSVPVTIAGANGTLSMPLLPEWGKSEKDPLRHKLGAPPEAKGWKSGGYPIHWGQPVEHPSGHSTVEKALLKITIKNTTDEEISQKIYAAFPNWLHLFKQYIQLLTTQYTMGENRIVIDRYKNLMLFEFPNDKFEHVPNSQHDALAIEIGGKDTSIHLIHLQEACRLASLQAEPRLEYALLLEAYSAKAVGDYRKAIIETATALEVGLTNRIIQEFQTLNIFFGEALLNKYQTLGRRLELAQLLKILKPDQETRKLIVEPRNDVIHKGVAPDRKMINAAIEKASSLLHFLSPTVYQTPANT